MKQTIYQKNMRVLHQRHPDLYEMLNRYMTTDHIAVKKAENGAARLEVRCASGETCLVHNEQDPQSVAKKTARKICEEAGVLVLLGMGLGYLAQAIVRKMKPETALVVYEADPAIFLTALHHVDLRGLLSAPKVKIVVGPDADVASWCCQYLVQVGGDVRVIRYEPAFRLAPEQYRKVLEDGLVKPTKNMMTNLATVGRFGSLFTNSIFEAIPHIMTARGVEELKGAAAGWPAIIVGAGPSLSKNLDQLRRARGRVVMIAADTVLGYLLARGITPDFVVSVDPQPDTYGKYHGVDIPHDIRLVFHPSCNDQIVKHFPGPRYVTDSAMPAYQWLGQYWPRKGTIESEIQCQVHFGFNVADCLGCEPIILTGQDLCYTDDRMHVKGGSYLSSSEEDEYVKNGIPTRDMFGATVSTYPVYLEYKHTWERKIAHHSGTVINATEGGLNLNGAENLRLADVLGEYCGDSLLSLSGVLSGSSGKGVRPDWDGLITEVRERCHDFFRLGRVSQRVLGLIERIQVRRQTHGLEDRRLVKWVNQAERLTQMVPRYAKALGLLQMVDMGLELYMLKDATQAADSITDPLERLDQQLIRGQRYYGDLHKAAPILQESLSHLLSRLERLRCLEEGSNGESENALTRVEDYCSLELYQKAEQVLDTMDGTPLGQHADVKRAAILGIRIPLALNRLGVAVNRALREETRETEDTEIRGLQEEANTLWATWQAKCREAWDSQTAASEPNPLEAGNFYYRVGHYSKAVSHYHRVMSEQHYAPEVRGEASYRLAKTYEALGEEEKVMQALENTLRLSPSDVRVYFELGVLALQTQRLEAAERFFQKGAELSLDDPEFCEAAGDVLASAGAQKQAIVLYERALLHGSDPSGLLRKISMLYQGVFIQPIASA